MALAKSKYKSKRKENGIDSIAIFWQSSFSPGYLANKSSIQRGKNKKIKINFLKMYTYVMKVLGRMSQFMNHTAY